MEYYHSVKVHHLNCGTLNPVGGGLVSSTPGGAETVCHCLLVESDQGLVLVDTGFGEHDIQDPVGRVGRLFMSWIRPRLDSSETALAQLRDLGHSPQEVRHIVLTHLDFDHAGGLADFPEATVHLAAAELDAAVRQASALERKRYRSLQWAHGARWACYAARGERWLSLGDVQPLDGLPPEILLVPLPGHTRGHSGVAVSTEDGWLLHAGDAVTLLSELDPHSRKNPALALYHLLTCHSRIASRRSVERLRTLARDNRDQLQICCSHDLGEFSRMSGKPPAWRP